MIHFATKRLTAARLLSATACAALVLLSSAPASAIEYPWCAEYSVRGGATNCGFSTFEQCRATVWGVGGYCRQNLFYRGAVLESGVVYRTRHAKKKRRHVHY